MRCRLSYCVTNLSGCRVLRRDRCELLMAPGSPDFEVPVPVSPGSPAGIRTSCCAGRHCRMRLDESGFQMPAGWLRGIFPSLPRLACLRCCSDYFSFSCDLCKKIAESKSLSSGGKRKALYRISRIRRCRASCHRCGNICISASCSKGGTTVKKA